MKIVHVITGLGAGGAEGVLTRLVENDSFSNTHIVVSLKTGGKYKENLIRKNVNVLELGIRSPFDMLRAVCLFLKILKEQKPDIIQSWLYHADLFVSLSRLFNRQGTVIWNIRNGTLDRRNSNIMTQIFLRILVVFSRFVPTHIISCSEEAALVHRRMGYPESKIEIIPNGIDMSVFNVARCDKLADTDFGYRLSEIGKVCKIGMVARFDPQKDHANLFSAINLIPSSYDNWHLILAGSGMVESNEKLARLIDDAGLSDKVTLLGPVIDIPQLMRFLDVHVLSSSYGEGFPNVLLEAMASGTPCIATDVGDASLIVGDNGWIVPRKNAKALSSAICAALNEQNASPGKWSEKCAQARLAVEERFSLIKMVSQYNKTWINFR